MSAGAVDVLHKSKVVQRPNSIRTTTLCGVMATGRDGMNVADSDARVTCKRCLRMLQTQEARRHG